MQKRAALYVRVSTNDQQTATQESELQEYARRRGWAVMKIYRDAGISGAVQRRPGLDALIADCRRRRSGIDVVLVWKFDRFARSLRHCLTALEEFRALGIDFCSATEPIDTTMPHGELVFQILAAVAQWERSLIQERVRAGIARAKREGKKIGRPQEITTENIEAIRRARKNGASFRALAARFGISTWSAHRACMA